MNNIELFKVVFKEKLHKTIIKHQKLEYFLKFQKIPHFGINTYLKWGEINDHFKLKYDNYDMTEISDMLGFSAINKYKELYLDLDGNSNYFYEIQTDLLLSNWRELLSFTGFEGFLVVTKNGESFLEFTGDHSCLLYSNFEIKADNDDF